MEKALVNDINPWLIRNDSFELSYYIFMTLLAGLTGSALWYWQLRRGGYSRAFSWLMLFFGNLVIFASLRLAYCAFYNPAYYLDFPREIFDVLRGGFTSHGALIGLGILFWALSRRGRRSFLDLFDRATFSLAGAWILTRLGNYLNSELVGRETGLPWGVRFMRFDNGETVRHPVQIYEALWLFLSLLALFWADRRFGRENRPRGLVFGLWMTVYFTGRFFLDFLKDLPQILSVFAMGQLLSVPCVILGIFLVWRALRNRGQAGTQQPGP